MAQITNSEVEVRRRAQRMVATRKYRLKHRDIILARQRVYARRWYDNHKELSAERSKKYQAEHKEEQIKKRKAHYAIHKEQIKKYQREYNSQAEKKLIRKNAHLKYYYGITRSDYLELFRKQNGQCAICGVSHLELTKGLFVDHNHDTNVIRGLLCTKCNAALGSFDDDIQLLIKAMDYLKSFAKERQV